MQSLPAALQPVSNKTNLRLQVNLHWNQAMVQAMTTYVQSKAKGRSKEDMIDDDSVNRKGSAHLQASSQCPRRRHSMAGPGSYLAPCSTPFQSLIPDLFKGSPAERPGIISGFFCNLKKDNPQTFALGTKKNLLHPIVPHFTLKCGTFQKICMSYGITHLQYGTFGPKCPHF